MGAGRQTDFTTEMGDAICALVSEGSNLNRICKEAGYPTRETVYKWLRERPRFSADYARARQDRADGRNDKIDTLQERLANIEERVLAGEVDGKRAHAAVQAIRAQIDALKWQAAHEAPKSYGDRVQVASDAESPIGVQLASLLTLEELTAIQERLREREKEKTPAFGELKR